MNKSNYSNGIANDAPLFTSNSYIPLINGSLIADDIENNFQFIYNTYHHRIYQVALRYLKSPANAQEVVQDVFMKLWSERSNIKSGTSVEGWLFTVAKNNTINRLKRRALEWKAADYFKNAGKDDCDDSTLNKLQDADYQQVFRKALKSLTEHQQIVFKLAREDNLSYAKIGERLGISPLTVKTHMSRSLKQLKSILSHTVTN